MKIGRNDPCPCGSGKKYKKCCLQQERASGPVPNEDTSSAYDAGSGPGRKHPLSARLDQVLDRLDSWYIFGNKGADPDDADDKFYLWPIEDYTDWERNCLENIFSAWARMDYRDRNGRTPLEGFLEKAASWLLTEEDRELLETARKEHFRILEVQSVSPGEGLALQDFRSRETFEVHEVMGTRYIQVWDLLLARLRRLGGRDELECSALIPRSLRDTIDEALTSLCTVELTGQRATADEAVFRDRLPGLLHALFEVQRRRQAVPPRLQTTDREDVLFCEARYDLLDEESLFEALAGHRSFEARSPRRFIWRSGKRRTGPFAGRRITLGEVEWGDGAVVLRTQSHERHEKGKALLQRLAPDALRHRIDAFQDPLQALKHLALSGAPSSRSDAIPEEVQREAQRQYYSDYYSRWLDEKVPALDGLTPRQASTDEHMQPRLMALLKDMENMSARGGGELPDFDRMWRQLGLERD